MATDWPPSIAINCAAAEAAARRAAFLVFAMRSSFPVAALRALARADPARRLRERQRRRHFLTVPRTTP